mmetsp:Transcript_106560/g.200690  ORF Transcript_106560/g.200690 Transcript_106560/m.200690 type:complete len:265 (-) Transcript_106560:166-960(-)
MDKAIKTVLSENIDNAAKREILQTVADLLSKISTHPELDEFRCINRDDAHINEKLTPTGWALLLAAGFSDDGNVLRYPASRDRTLHIKLHSLSKAVQSASDHVETEVATPCGDAGTRVPENMPSSELADSEEILQHLVEVQKRECPQILDELNLFGRKKSHWIWWVFPHEREGVCDPECTRVTQQTACALVTSDSAELWQAVLEKLCELLEEKGSTTDIIPAIDHPRIHCFLELWKALPDLPEWIMSVLQRLDKYADAWCSIDE